MTGSGASLSIKHTSNTLFRHTLLMWWEYNVALWEMLHHTAFLSPTHMPTILSPQVHTRGSALTSSFYYLCVCLCDFILSFSSQCVFPPLPPITPAERAPALSAQKGQVAPPRLGCSRHLLPVNCSSLPKDAQEFAASTSKYLAPCPRGYTEFLIFLFTFLLLHVCHWGE